jgi:hypothetical protein
MDSSANEREGYVMKEYNMEALMEQSAGRSQILRLRRSASNRLQAVRRKRQERRLSISDRYVD